MDGQRHLRFVDHLRRLIVDLCSFKGRSQRSEIMAYLVAAGAIAFLLRIVTGLFIEVSHYHYWQYAGIPLWVPAIPLFVRRLHDQDRTGWLALIMPALLGAAAYEQYLFDIGCMPIPALPEHYRLYHALLILVFWILVAWPGTQGSNRFGRDPRSRLADRQSAPR